MFKTIIGANEVWDLTNVGPISKFCDTNLVPISKKLWTLSRVGSQVSQESYFYRYGMSMSINLVKIKSKGINIEYHSSDTNGVCTMVWYFLKKTIYLLSLERLIFHFKNKVSNKAKITWMYLQSSRKYKKLRRLQAWIKWKHDGWLKMNCMVMKILWRFTNNCFWWQVVMHIIINQREIMKWHPSNLTFKSPKLFVP